MSLHVAEFQSSREMIAHIKAVKARRHAAEQAAEMRRRVPVPIAAEPLRAHVVTMRPRVCLPALVIDIRPWEAMRPVQYVAPPPRRKITIRDVQRATCRHFGIALDYLLSEHRMQPLARQRQIAMYVAYKVCKPTLPELGRKFNRDHTTALYGCRQIDRLVLEDESTHAAVQAIKAALGVVPEPPVELPAFLPRRTGAA